MRKVIMLLCSVIFSGWSIVQAQQTITGSVSTENGTPIAASIVVKGTTHGTTTDGSGNFRLQNTAPNATLIITAVGFKTAEEKVDNRTEIDIVLAYDAQSLDEIITVAYGTSKKGTFTGAADVISSKSIEDRPTTSFQNALVGQAPGVSVTESSGQAGSAPSIQIRGIGSMNASTQPLYVIDGVPVVSGDVGGLSGETFATNNIMNTLNPADIESISILKDAAAASLYGSRAANGVVLITTKKGKSGKARINLKSSIGFTPTWATDNWEVASTQDNVNYLYRVFHDYNTSAGESDAEANADALGRLNAKFNKHGYFFETNSTGLDANVNIKGMTDGLVNRDGKYFDWDKAYFRTGVYQTNNLSVSGGNDATKYYSSVSYTLDKNRIKVNGLNRITGRLNLSQKVGKRIELASNINVGRTRMSGYNDTRNTQTNYFEQTRNFLWGLYWPTDYKTGEPWTSRFGSLAQNNVYYDGQWENSSTTLRMTADESFTLHILPGLDFKTIYSFDNSEIKDHIYYSRLHYNGAPLGEVDEMSTTINRQVSSTTLTYDKDFGLHHINILAGYEAEKNRVDFQRATGKDLPSSALHTVATAGDLDAYADYSGNSMESVLSRAEYDFDQKYFLSASFRRDGSSKLSPNTRWGNFYSVAASWKIDKEDFMQDVDFISNLRLRASYGTNGTLPAQNYGWRSLAGYTLSYMEQAGGGLTTIADENLLWEKNQAADIGLEFGLFEQRVFGTIDYFNRNSVDLLQDVPISGVTGFLSTLRNIGKINNKGVEFQVGVNILRKRDLNWNFSVNGSYVKSEVIKLSDGQDIIWDEPVDGLSQFIYREGESTLAFYGYEYAGVDKDNGQPIYFVNDPEDKSKGDFEYKGRGATNDFEEANYVIIGNAFPKLVGGFNTDLTYKGFTLNVNFIYKLGGLIYDGVEKDVSDDGYYWERTRSQYAYDEMWTPENHNGTIRVISGNDPTDAIQYSTRHLYSGTFLRLKNLTLGYNIPKEAISKIGLVNARVFFNGTNLWTAAKYKHADPEVNSISTKTWATPFAKTYTFGIEVGF